MKVVSSKARAGNWGLILGAVAGARRGSVSVGFDGAPGDEDEDDDEEGGEEREEVEAAASGASERRVLWRCMMRVLYRYA